MSSINNILNCANSQKLSDFLLNSSGGLKAKFARSTFWAFFLKLLTKSIGFVRILILARILLPSDFGLMGIALLSLAFMETISSTGFEQALIQKKGKTEKYLSSVWTANLFRSLILFVIIIIAAPFIAFFFNNPSLVNILRVISFGIVIYGLTNVKVLYFQKELEFKKYFYYQISGIFAEFLISILLALLLQNVWALVFGLLAGNFVRLVSGFLLYPWKPKIEFCFAKLKELFSFGKWVVGTNILGFLLIQGDDLLVGKILGTNSLGLYQMAYRTSNITTTEVSHVVNQISFPALAKIQTNQEKVKSTYLRIMQFISVISFPLGVLIIFLASDFVKLFLTTSWLPMVIPMQILALWGLIRAISASNGTLFQAYGKPQIETKLQLFRFLIMVLLIFPFMARWNTSGAALAVFFAGFFIFPFSLYQVKMVIGVRFREVLKTLLPAGLGSALALFALFWLKSFVFTKTNFVNFFGLVFAGFLVYLAFLFLYDNVFGEHIFRNLRKKLKNFLAE